MSQTVTATAQITLTVNDAVTDNTIAGSGDVMSVNESYTTSYDHTGGTAPTVGLQWSGTLSLVAATPQTLDLTALSGPRGSTVSFASVRLVYVYNTTATAGYSLKVGNAGSNAWTAPFTGTSVVAVVPSNSRLVLENADTATPWVVDSTHKNLKFDPSSNALTVRVLVIGS